MTHEIAKNSEARVAGPFAQMQFNADGTITPLKVDPVWDPSWAFHPLYTRFTPQAPQIIPVGSTLHTTCTWVNTGTTAITFPDEMCIFGAFFVGATDVTCANGAWR